MSDSGLGFSPLRFVLLIVVIALLILLIEVVSDFGGGLIKGQVKRTTSKYNQENNTVPVFVLTQKEEQPANIEIQESAPPLVLAALSGEEVYNSACIACHMTGAGGLHFWEMLTRGKHVLHKLHRYSFNVLWKDTWVRLE